MELSEKLKAKCQETQTSEEGMKLLVNYYINSLGWSEEKANEYALTLFENGTIDKIKFIGEGGEEVR